MSKRQSDSAVLRPKRRWLERFEHEQQQCPICELFISSEDMADHFEEHVPADNHEDRNKFLRMYRSLQCEFCSRDFHNRVMLQEHLHNEHGNQLYDVQFGSGEVENIDMKFDQESVDIVRRYKADMQSYDCSERDETHFLKAVRESSFRVMNEHLGLWKNFKVFFQMEAKFSRNQQTLVQDKMETQKVEKVGKFTSFGQIVYPNRISHVWIVMANQFGENIEAFTCESSGWRLEAIEKFSFTLVKYNLTRIGTYMDLPSSLQSLTRTFLNVNNKAIDDSNSHNMCFVWSILAHEKIAGLPPSNTRKDKDKFVKTYQPYLSKLCLTGLTFPITLKQIPTFEKCNQNISLTILGYDMDDVLLDQPHRRSRRSRSDKMEQFEKVHKRTSLLYNSPIEKDIHIDLMMLMKENNYHFTLIRNLPAYLTPPNRRKKRLVCRNCLQGFGTLRTLTNHKAYCLSLGIQRTTYPNGNGVRKGFWDYSKTLPVPFRFYADFEALLPSLNREEEEKRAKDKADLLGKPQNESKRNIQNIHKPCGFAWTCVDYNGMMRKSEYYRAESDNEDIGYKFVESVVNYTKELQLELENYEKLAPIMLRHVASEALVQRAWAWGKCCLCKKKFHSEAVLRDPNLPVEDESRHVVRHHSHLPPYKFEGLAHNSCNLNAKIKKEFPVFFHNFSKYDAHFIVQAMGTLKVSRIFQTHEVIARSAEEMVAITLHLPSATSSPQGVTLRIQDSLSFTLKSLDKMVKTLKNDPRNTFPITRAVFTKEVAAGVNANFLFQKGVYPYEAMKSLEDFKRTSLPPIDEFYSELRGTGIDEEAYQNALTVWSSFNIQNMGEWHDLYVRLDSALLADVMEYIRRMMMNAYNLDLAHYISLPMMAFDCALKKSGIFLELITDPTMHCWIEQSIRGGYVSVGSLRAAAANNPYMGPEFQPGNSKSYLMYIDANNLYGGAMCTSLPFGGFEWVREEDLKTFTPDFISALEEDGPTGYFLEVDLEIPLEKHDVFNDFPPAPQQRIVQVNELSPYQRSLIDDLSVKGLNKVTKMVADLNTKENYILHYRVLQQYLRIGVQITKVHRAVQFRQCKWLKTFIDFNSEKRKQANSDFEKDFWKLLNNSAFGKTIEQVRNRKNVKIIMSRADAMKYIKKPTVANVTIINKETCIFVMKKLSVKLNKPIYVGVTVLDEAKRHMYNHYYNEIGSKYGSQCRLLYTDTDSFIYHVDKEDVYEDMKQDSTSYDMSEYPPGDAVFGRFHNAINKKVVGKFKDERAGHVITHVVCPKPKMYTIRTISRDEVTGEYKEHYSKRMKGITSLAANTQVDFDDFKDTLDSSKQTYVTMHGIRSHEHRLFTEVMEKKALNGLDTKRYALDSVNTLAFGHKDIYQFQS